MYHTMLLLVATSILGAQLVAAQQDAPEPPSPTAPA